MTKQEKHNFKEAYIHAVKSYYYNTEWKKRKPETYREQYTGYFEYTRGMYTGLNYAAGVLLSDDERSEAHAAGVAKGIALYEQLRG